MDFSFIWFLANHFIKPYHVPINCFGALKAAVDTLFLLVISRAALFSTD